MFLVSIGELITVDDAEQIVGREPRERVSHEALLIQR